MVEPLPAGGTLSVQVEVVTGYAVARQRGSVDFGTHELLAGRLSEAVSLTSAAVIVDMTQVGF